MSLIALALVMLLAMLLLGGLAAVVFALVYAIANKRPGVALAAVLVPVGAVVALGVLAAMFVGTARFAVHATAPTSVEWKGMPPMPPMPAMPPMPPMAMNGGRPTTWVYLFLIIAFVGAMVFRKRGCHNGERRGGWGKAILVGLLLFLMASYFMVRVTHRTSVAHSQSAAERDLQEQIRRDVEHAQQHTLEAQRRADAVQEEAAKHRAIEFKNMQELWEKFNQPRIKLESDEQGTSMKVGDGSNRIEMVAPADGNAKLIVPLADKTPESLARSLARLERMVEQVSTVADQVSDAGTLVGKAMIALNETMDSRQEPAPPAAAEVSSAAPSVPAIQAALPREIDPSPDTVASIMLVNETQRLADEQGSASRPAWIDDPPKNIGNVRRQVIVVGDFVTLEECIRETDRQLCLATFNRLRELSNSSLAPLEDVHVTRQAEVSQVRPMLAFEFAAAQLSRTGIGVDYIRREIAKNEYVETVERSFGPMKKLYTQIEFSPAVDQELRQRWDEYRRQERFAVVGAGAGSVLGLIGLAFGLLKVDTWTKGYYTKRLFLGVPAAIIGLIGLLSMVAE